MLEQQGVGQPYEADDVLRRATMERQIDAERNVWMQKRRRVFERQARRRIGHLNARQEKWLSAKSASYRRDSVLERSTRVHRYAVCQKRRCAPSMPTLIATVLPAQQPVVSAAIQAGLLRERLRKRSVCQRRKKKRLLQRPAASLGTSNSVSNIV
jgi:hypothetical protein